MCRFPPNSIAAATGLLALIVTVYPVAAELDSEARLRAEQSQRVMAQARRLELTGHDLDGVFYLRDLNDVVRIRGYIGPGKSALLVAVREACCRCLEERIAPGRQISSPEDSRSALLMLPALACSRGPRT